MSKLNELDGRNWIKFSKSWFVLSGKPDKKKTGLHPGTFPFELAHDFIEFFTRPGETVFDPFAGTGTTLAAAEEQGRKAKGIELDPGFAEFAATRCRGRIEVADARIATNNRRKYRSESIHYVFTSPPYWNMLHRSRGGNKDTRHKQRQSNGERLVYGDRSEDLGNMTDVAEYMVSLVKTFDGIHRILAPRRYCTIVIQNMNWKGSLMPIAWEFALEMVKSGKWDMKGEKIWCQENKKLGIYGYPYAYATNNVHHYCLTFRRI